jgi:hypothetical protein
MSTTRPADLDFGPHEKSVRWIEETPVAGFPRELGRKLAKAGAGAWDGWIRAGALAAARSTRHDGAHRVPRGIPVLAAARALQQGRSPDEGRSLLFYALRLVNGEIHDPGLGPFRLLPCDEVPGDGKEGTIFSFLEAVRAGEADWADHRFAWLVRNLEKEQVIDLLLSSGLEGVAVSAERVAGVVEAVSLLQAVGWEHAPVLLRPVVRHQAAGNWNRSDYERCRDRTERGDLHRLVRRRPPGQPALGERDAEGFLAESRDWAEAGPEDRTERITTALAAGLPLEDAADVISTAATLLVLQEILRRREPKAGEQEFDSAVRVAVGVNALCRLVRLGMPGQRILGLLLAAWVEPARDLRLESRDPDAAWWLPAAAYVREPLAAPADGPNAAPPPDWASMIGSGQPNGLLPTLCAWLDSGKNAGAIEGILVPLAAGLERVPGQSIRLVRTLAEAYRSSRTPFRWMHLWAASLALTLWPRGTQADGEEGLAGSGRVF